MRTTVRFFAFKEPFNAYGFVDHPDFFRRQAQCEPGNAFRHALGSSCFCVSGPRIVVCTSFDCSAVYDDAISCALERTAVKKGRETRVLLGPPLHGAGFVLVPVVFLEATRTWTLIRENAVSPVRGPGVKKRVDASSETIRANAGFRSAIDALKRPDRVIHKNQEERFISCGPVNERDSL